MTLPVKMITTPGSITNKTKCTTEHAGNNAKSNLRQTANVATGAAVIGGLAYAQHKNPVAFQKIHNRVVDFIKDNKTIQKGLTKAKGLVSKYVTTPTVTKIARSGIAALKSMPGVGKVAAGAIALYTLCKGDQIYGEGKYNEGKIDQKYEDRAKIAGGALNLLAE